MTGTVPPADLPARGPAAKDGVPAARARPGEDDDGLPRPPRVEAERASLTRQGSAGPRERTALVRRGRAPERRARRRAPTSRRWSWGPRGYLPGRVRAPGAVDLRGLSGGCRLRPDQLAPVSGTGRPHRE